MFGNRSTIVFAVSLGALIVSIILAAWGIPKIISKQIQKNVQIDKSSQMYEKWRKLPFPMTFKIYVFNVTNVNEINNGAKPKVKEVGPFVYKQYRERKVLSFNENNDTVEYMLKKTYVFDAEASGDLTEDTEITVINFSYMAALLSIQEIAPGFITMANPALELLYTNLTDAFLKTTASNLFFDGIYLNCEGDNQMLELVCKKIKSDKIPTMRVSDDGKGFYFSMFSHLNITETGPYEMMRGIQNLSELGHIVSYDGQRIMKNWHDPYCGQLNGSDSTIYPPIEEGNAPLKLYTFEPDICRSLYASLVGERTLFNMSAYYYEISESALAAKSANPSNRCFCKTNWSSKHDGCLVMGVMNLMPCQGAPAILSLPHFYLASEELLQYIDEGIQPDKEKHNTFVYLDPVTGVALKGMKRIQFNIELRKIEGIKQVENVRTGLFPFLWIEEGAELPGSLLNELRQSHALLGYANAARWLLLGIAIVATCISGYAVGRTKSLLVWPQRNVPINLVMHNTGNFSSDSNKIQ